MQCLWGSCAGGGCGSGSARAPLPPAVAQAHRHLLPLFVALVVVTYVDR